MQVFTFYKENKDKFTLDSDELEAIFTHWIDEQDPDWVQKNYSGLILLFISSESGLNSVPLEASRVARFLEPIRNKHIEK